MKKEMIAWKFHSRVFNSLGTDLVTDDIVAIIELVKNAYDAGANEVTISFLKDTSVKKEEKKQSKGKKQNAENTDNFILEICDNGQGMTKDIIRDVWFTVATPYKEENKTVKIDKETKRTVSGEKGLGRLSAARLGSVLEMYTKSSKELCYKVTINWDNVAMSNQETPTGGILEVAEFPYNNRKTGTVLRIKNLRENWFPNKEDNENEQEEDKIEILEDNLSRFISPFNSIEKSGNFRIFVKNPIASKPISISTPDFLNNPVYSIRGEILEDGSITYIYNLDNGVDKKRKKTSITAKEALGIKTNENNIIENFCGPFSFEIRVWDVDSESTEIFTKRFNINKVKLMEQISLHKGISVYRDGVLVLPKTYTARDWLGLDLRRISRVGKRISNRQIIGYVSITEGKNKRIEDASNREGFKNTKEVRLFKKYLTKIVDCLENLRENDKLGTKHKEPAFSDVLAEILPTELKDKIEIIVNEQGTYDDILEAVREYEGKAKKTKDEITRRAYYYSRLASIGTLASFLIHEIKNRTGSISDLHTKIREPEIIEKVIKQIEKQLLNAEDAVNALEILSNTFSPLAMKNPNPRNMVCDPVQQLKASISSFKSDIEKKDIVIDYNQTSVVLKMYPGELSTIFFNLLSNSVYWFTQAERKEKIIKVQFKVNSKKDRLVIKLSDSGPGISDGMEEKIFWPGWTKRKEGFGMGLTVASELVAKYGGNMSLIKPGELDGLTLKFDLPIYTKEDKQ
jgi:signal transduction histidine kinase